MKHTELFKLIEDAPVATRKGIYRMLAQELENVTIELPACGETQTIEQRYGGTDFDIGKLNVYASEGRMLVTHEDGKDFTILLRADQNGKY
jgi:hypothetical protein